MNYIGILSPNGSFIECESYEHIDLAKELAEKLNSEYTKCLRIDGKQSTYYTRDIEKYEVVAHIDITKMIMESDSE